MTTDLEVYETLETSLIRPAAGLAEIQTAFREYQDICEALLDASDYQTYEKWNPETRRKEPAQFKKRSAWRKLATAMGVRFEIISTEKRRDENGRTQAADFVARAIHPNGRYADGWGNCDYRERCKEKCAADCNGFHHFSKPEHDIPATAETRAKNRAAADLFGLGEVSAEEMQGGRVREEPIEDAEIVTDPDGSVFPDQRQSGYQPPAGATEKPTGTITEAQQRMIRRLQKKLGDAGHDMPGLHDQMQLVYGAGKVSELSKTDASKLITDLKKLAGEE